MSSFTEFLRSRQDEARAEQAGLEARKQEWLRSLDDLFGQIEGWLSEPVRNDLMRLERDTTELTEYRLGSYRAPRLVLRVGFDTVLVEPVGAAIIGAKGRVDVKTRGVSFKLILTDKGWGILEPERTTTRRLDEAAFLKALQDLLS